MLRRWVNNLLCFASPSFRDHEQTRKQFLIVEQKAERLASENASLSLALRNATDKASGLQTKLNDLLGAECPTCLVLKQTVNFHVLAAGSRVKMYDDVGPTMPPPKYAEKPPEGPGPHRARQMAAESRAIFAATLERELQKDHARTEPPQ